MKCIFVRRLASCQYYSCLHLRYFKILIRWCLLCAVCDVRNVNYHYTATETISKKITALERGKKEACAYDL
jgi:hypothetical protein